LWNLERGIGSAVAVAGDHPDLGGVHGVKDCVLAHRSHVVAGAGQGQATPRSADLPGRQRPAHSFRGTTTRGAAEEALRPLDEIRHRDGAGAS
jgi:hypothetical protein